MDRRPKYVRHSKKPEWGIGTFEAESEGRISYRFDDGEVRRFFPSAYEFLLVLSETEVENLRVVKPSETGPTEVRTKAGKIKPPEPIVESFEQQVDVFKTIFPRGFSDDRYIETVRGIGGAKPTRYERQLTLAADVFEKEAVRTILILERGKSMLQACRRVLAQEHSVVAECEGAELAMFLATVPDEVRFSEAFFSLLFGRGDLAGRVNDMLVQLSPTARSWGPVAGPLCLVNPEVYGPVDPQTTFKQFRMAGLSCPMPRIPNGHDFVLVQQTIRSFSAKLMEAELMPRDRIDAHLFSVVTLAADALRKAKRAQKAAAAQASTIDETPSPPTTNETPTASTVVVDDSGVITEGENALSENTPPTDSVLN